MVVLSDAGRMAFEMSKAKESGKLICQSVGVGLWVRDYLDGVPNHAFRNVMVRNGLDVRAYDVDGKIFPCGSHAFDDGSGIVWVFDEDGLDSEFSAWRADGEMGKNVDAHVDALVEELKAFYGLWNWNRKGVA